MSDDKPLKVFDFGILNIVEWHNEDFIDSVCQKAVFESEYHSLRIELSDFLSIDYDTPSPAPGIMTQVHLTGEVMPYDTYMFVSAISKEFEYSGQYIIITLSKYEAETEKENIPIKIKIHNTGSPESNIYLKKLLDLRMGDRLALKAKLIDEY